MRVKVSTFLYNFQQPKKKIDLAVYTILLQELKIPQQLVSNTHAKKVLKEIYSDEEKEEETKQSQEETEKQANRAVEDKVTPLEQNLQNRKIKQTKRQSRRRKEKNDV